MKTDLQKIVLFNQILDDLLNEYQYKKGRLSFGERMDLLRNIAATEKNIKNIKDTLMKRITEKMKGKNKNG